jgi:hypothetical protein
MRILDLIAVDRTGIIAGCKGEVIDRPPPNGLPISGGAPIDQESCRQKPGFKIAPILGAQSAVRCMGLLGRSLRGRVLQGLPIIWFSWG